MQIDHNGLTYRAAYPFNHKPSKVTPCELIWRVPVFGLLQLLLSLVIWPVFCLLFGAIFWLVFGSLAFFFTGSKFTYLDAGPFGEHKIFGFVIGNEFLGRLMMPNYSIVPIESLPTIYGKQILPIYPFVVLAIALVLWPAVPIVVDATVAVPLAIRSIVARIYELGFIVALGIGILLVGVGLVYATRKFLWSEMGKVFVAYLKARKEKICPIIEVV
ncbi:MAG: hypothetical protein Q8L52_03325 [bacterium]|nr:hypothetical protein [bacterium]